MTSSAISRVREFATQRATLLARVLWVAALVLIVLGIALWSPELFAIFFLVVAVSFATVGVVVASRRPANPIGWLFLAFGVVAATTFFGFQYGTYALITHPGSLPGGNLMASLGWHIWHSAFGFFILSFLLFPHGQPLSARWRPVVKLTAVNLCVGLFSGVLEWDFMTEAFPTADPLITGPVADVAAVVFSASLALTLALLATSGVSLILRLRRAKGDERQQLKWFVFAVAVFAVALPGGLALFDQSYGAYTLPLVPIAAGMAILRYRLYDIDVVINKTLVFGALASFITAVYVVVVVGIGTVLSATGGNRLELSIAATALVAVAFQPVRERVQRLANRVVYGERATPYEVMSVFARSVAAVLSVDDVLPRMAEATAAGLGAARVKVFLFLADGSARSLVWPAGADGGFDTRLEISHRGERVGRIEIAKPPEEPLKPAERVLLNDLASQAAIALHNARLALELQARLDEISEQAAELARSRERLLSAADASRRRTQRSIHAGPERRLQAMQTALEQAVQALDEHPQQSLELLESLQAEANATLEKLRDLARGIYPPLLADKGLVAALQAHTRRSSVPIDLHFSPGLEEVRYERTVEAAVYFCTREALDNVETHSPHATAVVTLEAAERELVFSVQDDGRGFDMKHSARRSRLQWMADRLEALGGSLTIESSPGHGTTMMGRLPVPAAVNSDQGRAELHASSSSAGPNSDLGMNAAAPASLARGPSSSVS